jgi:hypothetical protein
VIIVQVSLRRGIEITKIQQSLKLPSSADLAIV